jgi:hypothetical protein
MHEIGPPQLQWLLDQLAAHPAAPGMMCLGGGGRVEPFPLALRRKAQALVEAQLEGGHGSVHELATMGGVMVTACSAEWPKSVWTNLNRPTDVDGWRKRLG